MATPDSPHVFRNSPLGVLAGITLAVCVTPAAVSAVWLLELYLLPIAVIFWVLRIRTTVDDHSVTTRGILRTRRVAWSDITALRLRTRSRVSAVLADGGQLPLPAVHVRDLPLLAAASGGRVPDPTTTPSTTSSPKPSTKPSETSRASDTPRTPEASPAAPASPASPEE